jgi:hypothetical protein
MIVDNKFSLDTHKKKLLQRQLCTLPFKKKKKKRIKSNMTIGDNLTIFRHHMPLNIKEDMIVHLKRWRKISFGYRVASHAPPKWCKRHLLANVFLVQSRIFF